MHYFIDGYNLMFRVLRAGEELQAQREAIIADISHKAQILNLNITIFFDSQYQKGESTRSHHQRIEIIYTGAGDTADEYIIRQLKKVDRPHLYTLVTSDNKLAWRARQLRAKTESVESFSSRISKMYANKLRQRPAVRDASLESPAVLKKQVPKKKLSSMEKLSPEECFDFYLEQFIERYETEFEEQGDVCQPISEGEVGGPPPSKKKRKREAEPVESDIERWLRIFGGEDTHD